MSFALHVFCNAHPLIIENLAIASQDKSQFRLLGLLASFAV